VSRGFGVACAARSVKPPAATQGLLPHRTSLAGTSWPLSPKQDLAGGHHLRTDAGRLPLPGFHPGHSFEKDRRLVDGRSHEDGTRDRRPADGSMEAQAIRRTRSSFRSRRPVEGDLVRQAPRRGRHRSFDGKDRNRPGQSAMAESLVATLKTELLLVHRRRFPDREVARSATFEYLEGFYNRRRLHSALNYRSPADYEEATMEGVAVA
jgi:Integrase core domain